jgi:hypothetical protein
MTPKNPFPGMNPFFERVWYDAHPVLLIYIRDALQERLPADLVVRAEEGANTIVGERPGSTYRPDISVSEPFTLKENMATAVAPAPSVPLTEPIRIIVEEETERWLEIRDTSGRLITVLELLSPSNKRDLGREDYLRKRRSYIAARVNLVEIDLIRQGGSLFPDAVRETLRAKGAAYSVCVFRAAQPVAYETYPVSLRERLPAIRVPLRPTDPDATLDLQPLIDQCYQRGRYQMLDYTQDPEPPFSPEDAAWIDQLLRQNELRK